MYFLKRELTHRRIMVHFIMFFDTTRIRIYVDGHAQQESWSSDQYKRHYSHLGNIETGAQHNFVQKYYVWAFGASIKYIRNVRTQKKKRHKRIRIGQAGLTLALTTHFRVLMSLQINIMKMIIEGNFITIGIILLPFLEIMIHGVDKIHSRLKKNDFQMFYNISLPFQSN